MTEQTLVSALDSVGVKAFPVYAPQDEPTPHATYKVVYDEEVQAVNCRDPVGRKARIQVDIFGSTYEEVKNIAATARGAIRSVGGRNITTIDDFDEKIGRYRQIIDFSTKE